MHKVVILIPQPVVLEAVSGTTYCFDMVNMLLQSQGKAAAFEVTLAGLNQEIKLDKGRFAVYPDKMISEVGSADLIIIPPMIGDLVSGLETNKAFLPWLRKMHSKGAEVASLCIGAFMLAASGLVDGKKCSTHWDFVQQLTDMYPEVHGQNGAIVTETDGIYSSGGANSYWNLLLHLVEKYTDRATAILLAKYFALDIDRYSQTSFTIFRGQKNHADEQIKEAQEIIENQIDTKLTIDELADKLSIGRRSFERRFRQATSNSVLEYMQRVKMEAAKKSFETSDKQISQVMFEVGYNDSKAFRTVFRKNTGLSPAAYRKKYNKMSRQVA